MKFIISESQLKKIMEQEVYTPVSDKTNVVNNKFLNLKTKISSECRTEFTKAFTKAKTFLKNWLSNPKTVSKIKKNNNFSDNDANFLVEKYKKILDIARLEFYNEDETWPESKLNASAFVSVTEYDNTVHCNCAQLEIYKNKNLPDYDVDVNLNTPFDENLENDMIHELTHLLDSYHRINPESMIQNVFGKDNLEVYYMTEEEFSKKLIQQFEITKQESDFLVKQWLKIYYKSLETMDEGYQCDSMEKMANVMSIRKTLGVKPEQNITLEMILPYIKFQRKAVDVDFLILCWIEKGFPDFNQVIHKINMLANVESQKTNKNDKSSIDYSPEKYS